MKYMEYQEIRMSDKICNRLAELAELRDPDNPPVLSSTDFFSWIKEYTKQGWCIVWEAYNFPYIMLEREIQLED